MYAAIDPSQIREQIISAVSQPLLRAFVAAMPGPAIIERFDTTFRDDYKLRARFLARLGELCEQGPAGARYVAALMKRIEADFDLLPAAKKRSADAVLAQLASLLPEGDRSAALAKLVTHERISRRLSSYKIIKQVGDPYYRDALIQSYRMYGDEEALITLLRIGGDVSEVGDDPIEIIDGLTERYHQAVAIERILLRNEQLALSLAKEFQMAFIWAVGRQRHGGARTFVMECFSEALERTRATTTLQGLLDSSRELGLFVWALGRLDAREELASLAREYDIAVPWVT
jgi:hypothetical protein